MIGVLARPEQWRLVEEFFQLFKTPWGHWQNGTTWNVIISTTGSVPSGNAALKVVLGDSSALRSNDAVSAGTQIGRVVRSMDGKRIPVYGHLTTFPDAENPIVFDDETGEPVAYVRECDEGRVIHLGYDPFDELGEMLGSGQPAEFAAIMTADEHIAWLRAWITGSGVALVEIPPVPVGYPFTVCLTHDVDHPLIRNHRFDRTMFGFLFRSTVGALAKVLGGRRKLSYLLDNLRAAFTLPLVHLGVAKDLWADFDKYIENEEGCGSTFFVIPRDRHPGRRRAGEAPAARAAAYKLEELLPKLNRIQANGGEIAVHGVDAWLGEGEGRSERTRVEAVTSTPAAGVRMHWLYFDKDSPKALDTAGFVYDSTVGYCDTIGHRAGTAQVFVPPTATRLMELPLQVMDTALFYPSYLNLSEGEAKNRVWALIDDVQTLGGVLTINWHDRSIFPERRWDGFYKELLTELKSRQAWMPTASAAVSWFAVRRSASVETSEVANSLTSIRVCVDIPKGCPGLSVRIHSPRQSSLTQRDQESSFVDMSVTTSGEHTYSL